MVFIPVLSILFMLSGNAWFIFIGCVMFAWWAKHD